MDELFITEIVYTLNLPITLYILVIESIHDIVMVSVTKFYRPSYCSFPFILFQFNFRRLT